MSVNISANDILSSPPHHSDNHSYVNLNQTHTGARLPSYQESNLSSRHSFNLRPKPTPVTSTPINIDRPTVTPNGGSILLSEASLPQKWYSPPESVKSFSRPPSFVDPNAFPFKKSSIANSAISRPMSVASSIMPKNQQKLLSTIDEDNMVVPIDKLLELCVHSNEELQTNALGYLQHLTFNNPDNKIQVRDCNGLPVIIEQIDSENNYVARSALGVMKNMSFSDLEMITTDIVKLGTIQKLVDLIDSTADITQKELAIDILWNLSAKYNLKPIILTHVVPVLLNTVIIPDSGMIRQEAGNYTEGDDDIVWSTMLRNALGIIRNVSYENAEARMQLRQADGLIDCILYIIFQSGNREVDESLEEVHQMALIDVKIVENCVCILRNLTYAIQEIIDPDYLEKRKYPNTKTSNKSSKSMITPPPPSGSPKGQELLWNSKYIVTALFPILKNGANAVTLEAAAGVTQNLTAGDWEPSKEMQVQFRLQLALPSLIELINLGTNEVIRSAATALRNLVQEEFCRMLIGKNGLRDLTDKIPLNSRSKKIDPSALASVLSTIYVIILDQVEFMKLFVTNKGADRCFYIRDTDEFIMNEDLFPNKVKVFSQCILNLLWKTSPVQEMMKKCQIKPSDINPPPNQSRPPGRAYTPEEEMSNNMGLHDSIVSDQNDRPAQYPRDERYLRDSMAEIVSNKDLKERNSVAYTVNSVPGYGDVRRPASNMPNGPTRLDTIRSGSHVSTIVTGKTKTPVPSYHTRENSSLHNSNGGRTQSPQIALKYVQPVHASQDNRRPSNTPSSYSKTPRPSRDMRKESIALTQPPNNRVSVDGNRAYSNPYGSQSPYQVTSNSKESVNGNVYNRRNSEHPFSNSKSPRPSQDMGYGKVSRTQLPKTAGVSARSDHSNLSLEYTNTVNPKPISNIISPRVNGHSAV